MLSLLIRNLSVSINEKTLLKDVNLELKPGELLVIEGPNGAGKSSLAAALMGDPSLEVSAKTLSIDGKSLLTLTTKLRAKSGLFLSFQTPVGIPGIKVGNFLLETYLNRSSGPSNTQNFTEELEIYMSLLKLPVNFLERDLNEDFSGGEKKRLEALQMLLIQPKYAILDEIDSGVDRESLTLIEAAIKYLREKHQTGFIIISHYQKFIESLNPNHSYVLKDQTLNLVN
ncbi:MAG: Fe-S cluster assembly ATPase SufC [candidate division WWE3 bacterium]|nr:Fe-S cluster assembly ATPase SufC [candidate division WWE3 bacterium]